MDYKITGVESRHPTVRFRCDACHANLTAELADAGQEIPCPQCAASVLVPGVQEGRAWRQADQARQAALQSQERDRASRKAKANAEREAQAQHAKAARAQALADIAQERARARAQSTKYALDDLRATVKGAPELLRRAGFCVDVICAVWLLGAILCVLLALARMETLHRYEITALIWYGLLSGLVAGAFWGLARVFLMIGATLVSIHTLMEARMSED